MSLLKNGIKAFGKTKKSKYVISKNVFDSTWIQKGFNIPTYYTLTTGSTILSVLEEVALGLLLVKTKISN